MAEEYSKVMTFKIVNFDRLNDTDARALVKVLHSDGIAWTTEWQGMRATYTVMVDKLTLIQQNALRVVLSARRKAIHSYSDEEISQLYAKNKNTETAL